MVSRNVFKRNMGGGHNPPTFQPPFNKVFTGALALGIPVAGITIIASAVNFQNRKHGFDKNPVHN